MARIEITMQVHKSNLPRADLLDSGQRTSFVLPTDKLCVKLPLITDKQETTPIFYIQYMYGRDRLCYCYKIILPYCKP